ncbi:CIR protein, partial [Plasmodium chabaudi adami]
LKYMSEFYKLLSHICKTIVDYKDNGAKSRKLSKNSIGCRRQYRTLYNNISECKSYLDLLNKLKGLYDDFRSYAIKNNSSNNELETKLIKLTPENGKEMEAVRGFKTYNFNNSKCKFPPPKKNTKPKKQDPPRLPPSSKEEPPPPPLNQLKDSQHETPPSSQSSNALSKIEAGESSSSDVQDASKSGQNVSDGVQVNQVTHSKQGSPSSETGNEDTKKGGVGIETGNPGGGQDNQGGSGSGSGSEQGSQGGSGGSGGSDSDQHNSSIEIKEQENGTVDKSKQSQDGQQEISNPKQGNSIDGSENSDVLDNRDKTPSTTELEKQQSQSESKKGTELKNNQTEGSSHPNGHGASKIESKDSESSKSNTGGASGDTRSSSTGSDNLGDGSSDQDSGSDAGGKKDLQIDPIDPSSQPLTSDTNKEGSNSEPGSTDKNPLNGGGEHGGQNDQKSQDGSGSKSGAGSEQNPKDSDTGEKGPKNTSGTSFDFKPYMLIIKLKGMEQINNALKFFNEHKGKITDAIDTINSLYNTSVSNIKNNFYKFTEFFNNFIINLSIDSKQVENPPYSGDKQSGSGGAGDDPSQSKKDSTQQDSPQQDSTQQISQTTQTSLLPNSMDQTTTPQSPQDPSGNQISDQNDQEGPQKPVSASATKEKNPGTELKVNGMTEIGDSYVLKEYKKIVILIIVILIPITLTILYKYLSFGRRNELKKKNNMKKVINMIGVDKTTKTVINSSDGKKQIQIIIKSSIKKKQIKKSIKPIYREKSPSLNIYQFMQADPVPFINLFFLLIFFVYKRKRDFIE